MLPWRAAQHTGRSKPARSRYLSGHNVLCELLRVALAQVELLLRRAEVRGRWRDKHARAVMRDAMSRRAATYAPSAFVRLQVQRSRRHGPPLGLLRGIGLLRIDARAPATRPRLHLAPAPRRQAASGVAAHLTTLRSFSFTAPAPPLRRGWSMSPAHDADFGTPSPEPSACDASDESRYVSMLKAERSVPLVVCASSEARCALPATNWSSPLPSGAADWTTRAGASAIACGAEALRLAPLLTVMTVDAFDRASSGRRTASGAHETSAAACSALSVRRPSPCLCRLVRPAQPRD